MFPSVLHYPGPYSNLGDYIICWALGQVLHPEAAIVDRQSLAKLESSCHNLRQHAVYSLIILLQDRSQDFEQLPAASTPQVSTTILGIRNARRRTNVHQ